MLKSVYDMAVDKRIFLSPIIHKIFSLRADSHAQYALYCTKLFEDIAFIAEVERFVAREDLHGEGNVLNQTFKCAAELFLNLAIFHNMIYVEKRTDQERIEVIDKLLSFFGDFVLDTVTTAEDGNMKVMLGRHKILLLNNIALSGCVFSTYLGSLLSKAAGASTIIESCEFFKFSKGKIILFVSHACVVVERLHCH